MNEGLTVGVARVALLHEDSEEDTNMARRLSEHVEPLLVDQPIDVVSYPCSEISVLSDAFEDLAQYSKQNGPILPIFIFHGNKSRGMRVGEGWISWKSAADQLSILNKLSGNHMLVIAAACFGLNVLKKPDITRPAPFKVLCAPVDPISKGDLEDKLYGFFDQLFRLADMKKAIFSLNPPFSIVIPEILLSEVISVGLARMKGRSGDGVREEMINNILNMSPIKFDRSDVRRKLKSNVTNFDERLLNEITGKYLCGAPEFFSLEDLR